jgi:hypothetical protein
MDFWVLLWVIVLPLVGLGFYCSFWRMKTAMNDPERYRRFREWEEGETARQKKIFVDAAKFVAPAAKVGGKVIFKAITKR